MAVLAPQDWHPPRDHTMDASPSNPINPAVPRQRSSPVNDPSSSPAPAAQQQPYPYPVQQQQAGWSPSHSPQQYYPSFYQNHHQQSYPMHGPPAHAQQPHMHPQAPYYDQANAQFAQWAYQQMMFNAHQVHQMSHVPSPMGTQRSRSGTGNASDFIPGFAPFPSGTPPRHPAQLPNGYSSSSDHGQYQGFHPYRRPPQRQQPHNQDTHPPPGTEWSPAHQGSFQPPYARSDAAGSSTSVNSTGSGTGGSRPRTNSMQRAEPSNAPPPNHTHPKPSSSNGHGRAGSATSNASSQAPVNAVPRPHPRTTSSSSSSSAAAPRPSPAPAPAPAPAPHGPSTLRKPSPLSQGTFTAAEKRMSRDDSDLAAMLEPSPNAPGVRSGGLKGRLRRALSMNASATLREEDEGDDDGPAHVSGHRVAASQGANHVDTDTESTATVQKKKSRSLFNSRLNRSTDNISLSSTMSSASVVIRKLGNIGKLARRNSLAGITSLFKDKKDKDKDGDDGKKGKKGEKGTAAEASVSHATAELDRSDWTAGADLAGLSPAARLARQHTLKSNAEAAAKAKAEQEARAAAAAAAAAQQQADPALPTTWEKNTTSRQANDPLKLARAARVHEDGMRVIVEDDDSDSDDGKSDGDHQHHHYNADGWDDDEDWGEGQDEEDVTIRAGLEQAHLDDGGEEMEPWAINVRRSIEKTRRPTKGILKKGPDGLEYQQDQYLQTPNPAFTRLRSNSYDSAPSQHGELGPLAHMPSSDPDHIDGLHKHNHASNGNGHGVPGQVGFIPPLSFDSNGLTLDSPKDASDTGGPAVHAPEKGFFNHSNSSAPALSATFSPNPPTLSQRSATAPAKRLAFASNLSVYDTFPATVYDRRSEPATWSRLTPALAQRIKEELNSYKMEEMEVHAASRVHTQFFV
ncbi:hypothetical protein OBBRIDRAFT_832049 [Obba rivulosa]|uniref:Protein BNI4 n=1 Tax=Obba rivulosa TaxID=1052685 RepID=A0A8E2DR22_9APHY|nr:hypothetical protein OBBRIDRAFT_832049 [Obba rivulosa]